MTIVNGGLINVGKGGQAGGTGGGGTPLALSDGLACFAGSFSGITTASFSHGLNTTDIIVEFKDNSNNLLIPDNWLVINPNTIEVEFATPQIGNLVIIGCVASGQVPNVGGVTLLEGLSGIIDLDSPDGSVDISTSGQVINLTIPGGTVVSTTGTSLDFTQASGIEFVIQHDLNTLRFTWNIWTTDTTPDSITQPDNVVASGLNHVIISFDTPMNGFVNLVGVST